MRNGPYNCYAGIGSREITDEEKLAIITVASKLAAAGWVCYSGNAAGSDIAFQLGSGSRCVIFLPWLGFNFSVYNAARHSLALFAAGQSRKGILATSRYHPDASKLSASGKMFMARNYHQVMGIKTETQDWPQVRFILCCANEVNGEVQGGTGHACRIAVDKGVPVINMRVPGWQVRLDAIIEKHRQEEIKS